MPEPKPEPLFNVNAAEPIKWSEPKPLTRETFRAWAKAFADREEYERHKPRTHYVSSKEFEEYVELGICDREGRLL
jgi:hypothetical protein